MGRLQQASGKAFEMRLAWQAKRSNLWLISHGLKTQYLRGGRTIVVRSDLDFRLYDRRGMCCIFDAKSFAGDSFAYSALTPHQVLRAAQYAQWCVRSGFVVNFRATRQIVWYPIEVISGRGRRSRFGLEDGKLLGTENNFALHFVLS